MLKKRIIFLSILGLYLTVVGAVAFAPVASANRCGGVETSLIDCDSTGPGVIRELLVRGVNIFSIGVGVVAVIGISIAGVQYLTARDNEAQVTKAKRRLYEIIIGIAVYVLMWFGMQWLMPGGVSLEAIPVEAMTLSDVGITLGGTKRLQPIFEPIDATSGPLTWESSDESIATVDENGVVTAVSVGDVTITATTEDGQSASAVISVSDPATSSGGGTDTPGTQTPESGGREFINGNECSDEVIYPGEKYELGDYETRKIAAIIESENCGNLAACKAEASQMANLYEMKLSRGHYDVRGKSFYDWVTTTPWYSTNGVSASAATPNAIQAVEDVIIGGQRTLPSYVTNHDCGSWEGGRCRATTYFVLDGTRVATSTDNLSQLVPKESKAGSAWGEENTFYCVVRTGRNGYGDIFLY